MPHCNSDLEPEWEPHFFLIPHSLYALEWLTQCLLVSRQYFSFCSPSSLWAIHTSIPHKASPSYCGFLCLEVLSCCYGNSSLIIFQDPAQINFKETIYSIRVSYSLFILSILCEFSDWFTSPCLSSCELLGDESNVSHLKSPASGSRAGYGQVCSRQ